MDELIKMLNNNLEYVSHEIINETIYISVISTLVSVKCPGCNKPSSRVHAYYKKSFQDLPIQDKKVIIILKNRKMMCSNPNCDRKTFAETFEFLAYKAKKSKRLEDRIIEVSVNISSLKAQQFLRNSVVNIGKSTVCNLLKKRNNTN